MSTAAAILRILSDSRVPMNLSAIIARLSPNSPEDRAAAKRASHALLKLHATHQVDRVGEYKNYHYAPAGCIPLDFIPPPPRPRVQAARKPSDALRPGRKRILKAPVAAEGVPFQSVAEWLKRGGQVQRLPAGRMTQSVLRHDYSQRAAA